jgi:hypothetical protein
MRALLKNIESMKNHVTRRRIVAGQAGRPVNDLRSGFRSRFGNPAVFGRHIDVANKPAAARRIDRVADERFAGEREQVLSGQAFRSTPGGNHCKE